jgi:hypothetical protein
MGAVVAYFFAFTFVVRAVVHTAPLGTAVSIRAIIAGTASHS